MPFLRDGTEYGWKKRQGVCYFSSGQLRSWELAKRGTKYLKNSRGVVLRRWRNRMGRPLSPTQIHQKSFECWATSIKQFLNAYRGHQAPREAAQSLWKELEQNIKDKNRDKGFRDLGFSNEGEVSIQQETLLQACQRGALEFQRAT